MDPRMEKGMVISFSPVVPGQADDKIKIQTTGYGGSEYKSEGPDGYSAGYSQKPGHENSGKVSYTSYFKSGASSYGTDASIPSYGGNSKSYGGNSKSYGGDSKAGISAYGGNSKSSGLGGYGEVPYGGNSKFPIPSYGGKSEKSSYGGGDSKLSLDGGGHFDQELSGYAGHSSGIGEAGYGNVQAIKEIPSYDTQYESKKGSSYGHVAIPQYEKEPVNYEGGKSSLSHSSGYGIDADNVKYIPAQVYEHQQAYGKSGSYDVSSSPKGTPYVKEVQSHNVHSSYSPSQKGSYDGGHSKRISSIVLWFLHSYDQSIRQRGRLFSQCETKQKKPLCLPKVMAMGTKVLEHNRVATDILNKDLHLMVDRSPSLSFFKGRRVEDMVMVTDLRILQVLIKEASKLRPTVTVEKDFNPLFQSTVEP
ncbi:uncharacterized protein CEXT_37501 [Caerostris extrusa]|uniref:Uncharacterized protein n=1 Tax=Caerostris extrusa TaxID=172846 RepID=A0AAV4NEF8_CAEEX|nr:uncharacterized protein CEXT_37501 [Caerostris extrusa]